MDNDNNDYTIAPEKSFVIKSNCLQKILIQEIIFTLQDMPAPKCVQ